MGEPLPASAFDLDEILAGIGAWVSIESPTTDPERVNAMMDLASAEMSRAGATIDRHPTNGGCGDALLARFKGARDERGVLVLSHLDTVHPVGTLGGSLPLRRDGGRLYGPGVYDMKGGAFCACYAMRKVIERDGQPRVPVTFMFVPDEEFGSPSTRRLIEAEALLHRCVLVPEPAQDDGRLITGRWAIQRFHLRAVGRPAHAGATLADGRSALREMAEQVIGIESISCPEENITLSVGVLSCGRWVNVVPAECTAEVLAVTPSRDAHDRIREQVLALKATTPGIELTVEPGAMRPLFEPTPSGMALYRRAAAIAREIGFSPGHSSVGGGSDGNFTGALGVPTLDGLGLCGGNFHTAQEYVEIESIIPRTRLLSGLLR